MSFTSFDFAYLVVIAFGLYYLRAQASYQVGVLVIASLVFYGWDQWRLLPLLMIAVALTYYSMLSAIRGSRMAATAGIAGNLLILAFFKYKLLLIHDVGNWHSGSDLVDYLVHLPLPIGISFFVFHNISLIVDYFKAGENRDAPTAPQVMLYILFFPQLVSGPITRAISFIPQIEPKLLKDVPVVQAAQLLITGLFFKLFCANNLAQITAIMAPEFWSQTGGGDKLFILFVYSFQIYADFYGYSTIALGLALLFGYRLPVNFKLPYTAGSFADFWRRWHVSLSRWLREYLYIPLGGNRVSNVRTYVNLFIVMLLGGLWHGADISYAVWGSVHGALLVVELFLAKLIKGRLPDFRFGTSARVAYGAFVFVCVSLCWLLFRFQDFSQVSGYLGSIANSPLDIRLSPYRYAFALFYMSPVLVQHVFSGHLSLRSGGIWSGAFFGTLLWLAFAERGADTPFIYFRF